jgi:DNA-binding response OmpR family regulator
MSDQAPLTGALLADAGLIATADVDAAVAAARANDTRLLSQCLTSGLAAERDLCRVLARRQGHPVAVISRSVLDLAALGLVPRVVAEQHDILPVAVDDDTLTVAAADVEGRDVFEHVAFASGRRVVPLLALQAPLKQAIRAAYAALGETKKLLPGEDVKDEVAGLPLLLLERPPRAEDDVVAELVELADIVEEEPAPAVGHKQPVVLVVDDEADIRSLLKKALEKDGYVVETAADGRAAMARLRERPPGVVLLDAMLPEIHGFEICRAIKHSARWRNVPVIMISAVYKGWEQAKEIQEFHQADAFVEKPFDLPYVRELVARMMGRTAPRDELDKDRKKEIARQKNTARVSYEMGELGDATSALERWLELDPFDANAYVLLGNVHTKRSDAEEAMKAYERAATFGPDLYAAFKNLALTYETLGFVRRAYLAWFRARELADKKSRPFIEARLRERYAAFG